MLLIWIKYNIKLSDRKVSSILKFDSIHEKNLEFLYHIIKNKIRLKTKISMDQLATYCGYCLVKRIRGKTKYYKQEKLSVHSDMDIQILQINDVEQISFDVMVDSLPKKTYIMSLHEIISSN